MLPSHTVENYLKAIFQAQTVLPSNELVPMGQLAAALGVVPGTATTMVKALAESGLVKYEPYVGVRLTAAGGKLAALVLRRHRLIELFLVKVMGMSWAEVHDEAEHLEHAVSDRLIDRIDEMLGRPAVDPHGDPIPGPEGTVSSPAYETLLTCPLHAPVMVSRVSDQDSEFLRFAERNDLKPGQIVRVEERDPVADSVRLRGDREREVTIGARAASKVLVQAARMVLLWMILGASAWAQTPQPKPARAAEPFEITDNSFLVEEAFNQEAGIFQNIFGVMRIGGTWAAAFTQEWPLGSQTHQFSYTIPFAGIEGASGFGDLLLNYRYQLWTETRRRPAFSPRLSVIVPTGDEKKGFGDGTVGLQVNLPFSKQRGDLYLHWNAGVTYLPDVDGNPFNFPTLLPVHNVTLTTPHASGSAIWRVRPMFNLMVENVIEWPEELTGPGTTGRFTAFTLSPGIRGGWNIGDRQLILGVALPIEWNSVAPRDEGAFFYFSYELPFKK